MDVGLETLFEQKRHDLSTHGKVYLAVRVIFAAREKGIWRVDPRGEVAVGLSEPPVDGKANAQLLRLVKQLFRGYNVAVSIASGGQSKQKLVKIEMLERV